MCAWYECLCDCGLIIWGFNHFDYGVQIISVFSFYFSFIITRGREWVKLGENSYNLYNSDLSVILVKLI